MIFLTVGTQLPFDRLVKAVDEVIEHNNLDEEVFAQIGETSYKPRNFESVCSLDRHLFKSRIQDASGIIGHAGIGTITMALENEKGLLVMPRLSKYREAVNDHQSDIAKKFEQQGCLLVAYKEQDLPEKIEELRIFVPEKRLSQAEKVVERISTFLNKIYQHKNARKEL